MQPLLQLKGIEKSFPGVKALNGASLSVWPGRVMALVGGKRRGQIDHDESAYRHLQS